MLEQLQSASEKLRASIDEYLGVCSILHNDLAQGQIFPPEGLLACLEQEIARILPYEQKIQQARVTILRTRNYWTNIAPIGKLPSEILTRIFRLVSDRPCRLPPSDPAYLNHTYYPDWLAQICFRWRNAALACPTLWSHIDLTPHPVSGQRIWDRAQAYIQRVGNITYEIHLDDRGIGQGQGRYSMDEIVSSYASRLKALAFTITTGDILLFHASVLNNLFLKCNPETLKMIRLYAHTSPRIPFITDQNLGYAFRAEGYSGSENQIDPGLSGVTILHLQGVYMNWSSGLYHGLVDLRLSPPSAGDIPIIHKSELISILSSSPKLRVFHFALDLSVPEIGGYPVPLPELEDIQVSTKSRSQSTFHVGSFLGLLAPGSKSLRLVLETSHSKDEPLLEPDSIKEFFVRSKVEKLWIRNGALSVVQLQLCHLPDLKILVFDSCRIRDSEAFRPVIGSCTWVVRDVWLEQSDLHRMVESCPARLVLSQLKVSVDGKRLEFVSEQELRASFPTAEFLEKGWRLDRTIDWDVLDRCVLP